MIRALFPLLVLTACATFPQIDAVTPAEIGPRPPYLSPEELAAANARSAQPAAPIDAAIGDDLRANAEALRAR